ncbi:hypothetical protein E2562_027907 [Oryza meyeriana var. granulata]|uniref:Uncharacterized protein n=1 Tax=Oryza meyeriana var. granulata TaxID=110450 RepID=A0A6G1EZL5_9ORYZ|nr:hypothetical protein E2562_027907 [Oryza meyeriana var. granulata]
MVYGKLNANGVTTSLEQKVSRQARKGLTQSNLRIGTESDGRVTLGKYVFDEEIARKELALMICLYEYPLSIVDATEAFSGSEFGGNGNALKTVLEDEPEF